MSEEEYNLKLINKQLTAEVELLQKKIKDLKKDEEYFRGQTSILNQELDTIKYSRSYKIMQKIKKIIKRK